MYHMLMLRVLKVKVFVGNQGRLCCRDLLRANDGGIGANLGGCNKGVNERGYIRHRVNLSYLSQFMNTMIHT